MTNRYAGYTQPVPSGYRAMLRMCRDAKPAPVMEKGEKPKIFETEGEAWKEIAQHLLAFMNGREIRGEVFDLHVTVKQTKRAAAEKIFIKGKAITVETAKGGAA